MVEDNLSLTFSALADPTRRAMLMQLSEQSAAKQTAASAQSLVSGMPGNNATMVPAANKIPMASSFAGNDRQINPSG